MDFGQLSVAVEGEKSLEVGFGDPDDTTNTVDNEIAGLGPPADRTGGDVEMLRHLGDREKLHRAPTACAQTSLPGVSNFVAEAGSTHAGPSPARSLTVLAGICNARPKSRSSDGTFISRLEPIFVHSISPLFILL